MDLEDLAEKIWISHQNWLEIIHHIQRCQPEEGCGLVGGFVLERVSRTKLVLPVTNQLHSPVRFFMDPAEQLQAFLTLEKQVLDLIAIFHSHPAGPETPSPTDLAEFYYPGVITLILTPRADTDGWNARAFHLGDGQPRPGYREVPVIIGPEKVY